ncbi:MAG: helix-turn-helix domain-containing protein [Polyangiaceae bacterium]|jgi:hypothetical protein|nr:helix-turn-helix domain-containing protein [Polyangiaceae bacterium]
MDGSNGIDGTGGSESDGTGLIAARPARTSGMKLEEDADYRELAEQLLGADAQCSATEAVLSAAESKLKMLDARMAVIYSLAARAGLSVGTPAAEVPAVPMGREVGILFADALRATVTMLRAETAPKLTTPQFEDLVKRAVRGAMVAPASDMLNRHQLAEILDVDPKTIATYVERDALPAHGLGRNQYFFRSEVEQWLKERGSRAGAHADRHAASVARLRASSAKGVK